MGRIVVSENVSLDGIMQDPTGEEGFKFGGWSNQMPRPPHLPTGPKRLTPEAWAADGACSPVRDRANWTGTGRPISCRPRTGLPA